MTIADPDREYILNPRTLIFHDPTFFYGCGIGGWSDKLRAKNVRFGDELNELEATAHRNGEYRPRPCRLCLPEHSVAIPQQPAD